MVNPNNLIRIWNPIFFFFQCRAWPYCSLNLVSIVATAIPNATITWWYRTYQIGREDHDKNYKIHGHGPLSLLEVAPLAGKYFGDYRCHAENPHGAANHSIELILAQVTCQNIFVLLCLNILSRNQLKSSRQSWTGSRPPPSTSGLYRPQTSEDFRWTRTPSSIKKRGTNGTLLNVEFGQFVSGKVDL